MAVEEGAVDVAVNVVDLALVEIEVVRVVGRKFVSGSDVGMRLVRAVRSVMGKLVGSSPVSALMGSSVGRTFVMGREVGRRSEMGAAMLASLSWQL